MPKFCLFSSVNHAQLLEISLDLAIYLLKQPKTCKTFSEKTVPLHYSMHQTSGLGVN